MPLSSFLLPLAGEGEDEGDNYEFRSMLVKNTTDASPSPPPSPVKGEGVILSCQYSESVRLFI